MKAKPSPLMTEQQSSILRSYVNDMLAVERDLHHATSGQAADESVTKLPEVRALVEQISQASDQRIKAFETVSAQYDGKLGAAVKEAVAAAAGTLASLYGKVRSHAVSKMLRDDHVALNLASISYAMLYTTAVAFDAPEVATPALAALNETASHVIKLSSLIPPVVTRELEAENPVNTEAGAQGVQAIMASWENASGS